MEHEKLEKQLGLWDVYAIATGAMFSSGFFLLPGLAAAETGPSVFLAYLVSGLIVIPTMFSVAELATAMPKAGGTYYIIDRALGPLIGTIGGYGSWLALVLKSAFALIGMGAYISIFYEVPITLVAVILTVAFGLLNIVGAKETTTLQKILVAALITIMIFYVVQGLSAVYFTGFNEIMQNQFTPLFTHGATGFFATVGMVFVSYAGLTKVASIAEEVKRPDKNIPLGMFLAIASAIAVYVAGVYIMVALLEPSAFRADLTPVATAGEVFMDWLPGDTGLFLIVIAAIAAFASTGNAGIMSASRYPLAMARDKLITARFSTLSSRGTPVNSIIATVLLMVVFLLAFDVAAVAKLASAFQLLLFALLNLAVIVMRESRIEEYDPGFNSPFYPWIQIAGMILSAVLILEMGLLSILFTLIIAIFSVGWYYYYAYGKIERQGAIFHVHARLGKRKDYGLENEMRGILREKGLRDEDPYEKMASRSIIVDLEGVNEGFQEVMKRAIAELAEKMEMEPEKLEEVFKTSGERAIPIARGVAMAHARVEGEAEPEMVLIRVQKGLTADKVFFEHIDKEEKKEDKKLYAIVLLVSPEGNAGQHLRFLAQIAEMVDSKHFLRRWRAAKDETQLREILLRDERFINITLREDHPSGEWIGLKLRDISLPGESLVAIIKREGDIKIPHGNTVLKKGDELSIIGDKEDIVELREKCER